MEDIDAPLLLISSSNEYSSLGNDAIKKLSYKDLIWSTSEKDICCSIGVKIIGSNIVSFSKEKGVIFKSWLFFFGVVDLFWENYNLYYF